MQRKLRAITEQQLARLGALHCRVDEVAFSQTCPPVAVIVVTCEGQAPLPISIENAAFKEDLEPFILKKLQAYLTATT